MNAARLPLSTGRARGRFILRLLLAAAFLLAGYFHIFHPEPFLKITPAWVRHAPAIILWTGVAELLGATGLLIPRLRRFAAIMLALYAICVFPANIKHAWLFAQSGGPWTGWLYHGPRLLFQPVIVWWCLFAGCVIDWPFKATGPVAPPPSDPRPPHPRPAPKA